MIIIKYCLSFQKECKTPNKRIILSGKLILIQENQFSFMVNLLQNKLWEMKVLRSLIL